MSRIIAVLLAGKARIKCYSVSALVMMGKSLHAVGQWRFLVVFADARVEKAVARAAEDVHSTAGNGLVMCRR